MGSPYLCQLHQFYFDLYSILPQSFHRRLPQPYQYSPLKIFYLNSTTRLFGGIYSCAVDVYSFIQK